MSYSIVNIVDVCDFQGGTQPPKSEWQLDKAEGYIRMLQIRDFTQPKKNNIAFVKDKKTLKKCKSDDVLIGRYGASIGKILSGLSGAYNVAIIKTIPDESKLNKRYLFYVLNSISFQKFILNIGDRAAQAGFNKSDLERFQMPLPPLPEQKRIAEILDKADALRLKNKQLFAAYDELLQATFMDMFGDPVTNPKGWEKRPFNKCGHFTSGGTPDKSIKRYWDGKFPWVSPKDMKVSIIYDSLDHISESVFTETNLKRIPPNHLLIVVRGMILAHSFPLAINAVEVAINQDMKAIRPINNLNILYFQACLNSLKREVIGLMSTAGHGTKKFDKESMERLCVPLPPIKLQNQFAQIVENIDAQKALVKQSLQESEDLFNGLVQKAFGGEL